MKGKYYMSDAEQEVMEMLWKQGEPVRQSVLLEQLAEKGKVWKRQTLNTFLFRLEEKGLVVRENRKACARYTEEEYQRLVMKESIDKMYDGKLSNFMVAFTGDDMISREDAEELLAILEKKVAELREKEQQK